jgi:hypothetical protein
VLGSTLNRLSKAAYAALFVGGSALATPNCTVERAEPLAAADDALCDQLEAAVRKPGALPHDQHEAKLSAFLRNFCHRREAAGWKSDKHMRDTGPFIGMFHNGQWTGQYQGTHAPAVVWYSPDMIDWMKANRAEGDEEKTETPVPDGAIMVKEMFPPPTSHCKDAELVHLFPANGGAIMVRASKESRDGWFWAGSAGAKTTGRRPGRRHRRTAIRTRASGFIAPTVIRPRATTRPSRLCATSRASPASRWCS